MGFEDFSHQKTKENREIQPLHPFDILPTLSPERREDILEIVDFCGSCVERYTKKFGIVRPPQESFFLYENSKEEPLGVYESGRHVFGVQEQALYAPHILIHEMIHYISGERSERIRGFEYQKGVENSFVMFYTAINEGITDLIAQDIYSQNYRKLKDFFAGRGGLDYVRTDYSEETILVQKLIYYQSLIVSKEQHVPEEEAHIQVWNDLKHGYFTNDHTYLKELFGIFAQDEEEKEETSQFMQSLKPTQEHKRHCELLIQILDKKILTLRTWLQTT